MKTIKELILQDKLEEALYELRNLSSECSLKFQDNVILLLSRFRSLKKRTNQGILSEDLLLIEKNKIRIAILGLLNETDLQSSEQINRNIIEQRAALVIGCDQYEFAPQLPAAKNDAIDISTKLKSLNFDVSTIIDPTKSELEDSISEFKKTLLIKPRKTCLFYFAGHGIQIEGTNYLVSKNLDLDTESDAKENCISVDYLFEQMNYVNCDVNIVILDVCRNNPLSRNLKQNSIRPSNYILKFWGKN